MPDWPLCGQLSRTVKRPFFVSHGRYWQGLRTHSVTPAEGNTVLPNIGTNTPTDQIGFPWPTTIRNVGMEMALEIQVYDGPMGKGYVGIAQVTIGDAIWMRVHNEGPETWRTQGWIRLDPTRVSRN